MDERKRSRLCVGLAAGSPFAATLLSLSTFALAGQEGRRSEDFGLVVLLFNGVLAVVGSIAGVMLAPRAGVAIRVVLSFAFAAFAAAAYWITTLVAGVVLFGI